LIITSPLSVDTLDCQAPFVSPTITWNPGAYDKYHVYVSWVPTFAKRVGSGKTWLKTASWRVPVSKWTSVCGHGSSVAYIKVLGIDVNLPKKNPARRAYSNTVSPALQH